MNYTTAVGKMPLVADRCFVLACRPMPGMASMWVAAMGELSEHRRDVGGDIGVPFSTVNEVPRVIARIQKHETWNLFGGDAESFELHLELVTVDAQQAHLGECLLGH